MDLVGDSLESPTKKKISDCFSAKEGVYRYGYISYTIISNLNTLKSRKLTDLGL